MTKGRVPVKKLKLFANILLWMSLGLLAARALLSYNNYTRHVELFAAEGWLWYTDVFVWAKYILPITMVCLIVKIILQKK